MKIHEITYAISKVIPCIESEATFQTNYGDLTIRGKAAEKIAAIVRGELERLLEKEQKKTR